MVWCTACGLKLNEEIFCWRCGTKSQSKLNKPPVKPDTPRTYTVSGVSVDDVKQLSPVSGVSVDDVKQLSPVSVVPVDTRNVELGMCMQLSPGAMQSLSRLKRRLDDKTPQRQRPTKTKPDQEYVDIGVQIIDKHQKVMKNIFETAIGSSSIIHINVNPNSGEEEWLANVNTLFNRNMNFICVVPTFDGFEKPTNSLTMKDLTEYKKKKKIKDFRLYILAEGKDKNEIKLAFKGARKDHKKTKEVTSCKKVESCADLPFKKTKEVTSCKEVESCADLPFKKTKEVTSCKEVESCADLPFKKTKEVTSCKEVESCADLPFKKLKEVTSCKEVESCADLPFKKTNEVETDLPLIVTDEVVEDKVVEDKKQEVKKEEEVLEEEDPELERFMRLQSKLEERQQLAAGRITSGRREDGVRRKTLTIVYKARGFQSLTVKASEELTVAYLFHVVCSEVDCSQLATKFHFEDTEGNEVKRDQKLETTCDTLFIVEEDFEPDDTITNYDEVYFD